MVFFGIMAAVIEPLIVEGPLIRYDVGDLRLWRIDSSFHMTLPGLMARNQYGTGTLILPS